MLLPKEFVAYLSRQIIKQLSPQSLETSDPHLAAEAITAIIIEHLMVEERLNEEVREMLTEYSDYMRREGISYQEMFRKIKNTLVSQRKIVRAAGRDTGDPMKLSRDKITELSHKVMEMIRKSRIFRLKKPENDTRLAVVRIITEILQIEEKADKAARQKIRSQKREITEGTEEWSILHKRYYADELKKLGVDSTSG